MTDSEKIDLMLSKMQSMETKMQGMDTKMQNMETQMQGMDARMQNMETQIQEMDTDLKAVKHKVTDIDLMLENEIRVNLMRVAEGHLDLSRNLHDAIRIDSEKEMISIRVNMLESEVQRLKERVDQIA